MNRKMGISEATFYNGKNKLGGISTSKLLELSQLKEKNLQFKKSVAKLSLDKHMLQDIIKKSSKACQVEGIS